MKPVRLFEKLAATAAGVFLAFGLVAGTANAAYADEFTGQNSGEVVEDQPGGNSSEIVVGQPNGGNSGEVVRSAPRQTAVYTTSGGNSGEVV